MELGLDPHHRQNSGPDHIGIGASTTRRIGDPVTFVSGQFAGRTIRLELEEIQKADSGRKYAKVDRRPLDPPPAVLLRLFETDETGAPDEYSSHTSGSGGHHQPWEKELSYENVLNVGLICSLDLFPVPESIYDVRSPVSQSPEPASTSLQGAGGSSHRAGPSGINRGAGGSTYQQQQAQGPLTYFPLHPYTSLDVDGTATVMQPFQIPRRQLMLATVYPTEMPPDVIHRIGSHLVTESSKLTPALVGEKFAEPTLVDYKGEKVLIFVFGDLAVRREGVFILRYRVFDIYSGVPGHEHTPILAELYGGPFKVYSTREFPGLEPSTELTKELSKYGVRVTLRDAERKSKKRGKDS